MNDSGEMLELITTLRQAQQYQTSPKSRCLVVDKFARPVVLAPFSMEYLPINSYLPDIELYSSDVNLQSIRKKIFVFKNKSVCVLPRIPAALAFVKLFSSVSSCIKDEEWETKWKEWARTGIIKVAK